MIAGPVSRPSALRTFLRTGVPYGVAMGLWSGTSAAANRGLRAGVVAGLASGVLGGLFFGLFITAIARSRWIRRSAMPQLEPGERILREAPANHFVGPEAVGGWLVLTDRRLVFKSHRLNVQRHELSLRPAEIGGTEPVRTLGLADNGLAVWVGGRRELFVLDDREAWAEAIAGLAATHGR